MTKGVGYFQAINPEVCKICGIKIKNYSVIRSNGGNKDYCFDCNIERELINNDPPRMLAE